MTKEEIKKILEKVIIKQYPNFQSFEKEDTVIVVERPKEASHGDYSTNIALVLTKPLKKNPLEVAKKIKEGISNKVFEKVEVAPPGFINFYLKKEFFVNNIKEVLKNKNFGKNNLLKGKKIIIEYTDPNILKEFHIGHLMSNTIGESLSRIFEFNGASIKRMCYQSDVGLSIAKAVWGKVKNPNVSWQEAYVFGTKKYEESLAKKPASAESYGEAKEIIELNKKIFERSDKSINSIYDAGKKWSLEYFGQIYKKLGTKFDDFIFESQVADYGKKIVEDGLKKGIFEKGDNGAVIFKGEKFGLHTRVFINSEELPTYEAKELALAKEKYKKYKYNQSVVVTGNEINEYFKVLFSAMSQIFPDLAKKTKHIGHGMMRLPEGKMSSRTGKVVTFEFLLSEVEKKILEKMESREIDRKEESLGSVQDRSEIIEKVAIGALKYSILKQSIGSDIVYDFEKSISFEGDSGPYLQYSYARANSVLEKSKAEKIKSDTNLRMTSEFTNEKTSGLEKMMVYFPEVVQKAGREYEPHVIVLYLTELAREFNNYYANNKIVDKADEFSPHRVALTEAFSIIMKNGLWLLGIDVLEKM
ncbi:MAG: arginine--tRNA ligase [Candidatus Staskawiczbacteria bacterium RIFCSPHIGHO2_02_FULL_34_10]|uniref:Arginine--tRNA ligase n=2 Tax=Candidatus Staskawicziibacteriota TaxID=1817916 RepID=A0A1G2HMT1_9BACT|nr:MAG: arginine--tRNA ligase [Candidatus Staskawiczbacteria bacterium RIFCSPHIGHO2_01_FULL_34_27]OGZ66615.1 MAG: arginine--tRNA ligase [Candidatus Staskawiczbacteria bacterium RIFCSPHIGHO2_02_FULL_34_10]